MTALRVLPLALTLGLLSVRPVIGAEVAAPCAADEVVYGEEILARIMGAWVQETLEEGESAPPPAANPSIGASSSLALASSLVDGASLPSILGLAVNSGVLGTDDGVLTLDATLFALTAIGHPEYLSDQVQYQTESNRTLRRIALKVSSGGKGEELDRDGDGNADAALEAEELDDVLTWEVSYRIAGSLDRREPENWKKISAAVRPYFSKAAQARDDFLAQHALEFVAMLERGSDEANGCVRRADFDSWAARNATRIADLAGDESALHDALSAAVEAIDSQPLWTVSVGGTERAEGFGRDVTRAVLRHTRGPQNLKSTFNVEWVRADALAVGGEDQETWKLGYEAARRFLRGSAVSPQGILGSVSASYESFDNVPDSKHDTVAKANIKLELPLTASLRLPLSVTWANHKDLLSDESEIRGHFGLVFDVSKLVKATNLDL